MKRFAVAVSFDVLAESSEDAHRLVGDSIDMGPLDGAIVYCDEVNYDGRWLPEGMRGPLGLIQFGIAPGSRRYIVCTDDGPFASDGRAAFRMTGVASDHDAVRADDDVTVRDCNLPQWSDLEPMARRSFAKYQDGTPVVLIEAASGHAIVQRKYYDAALELFPRLHWCAAKIDASRNHFDAVAVFDADQGGRLLALIMGLEQPCQLQGAA